MKISRLLDSTPKWQHEDAKVRLQCLQNTNLPDEVVLSLALNDVNTDVRLLAITLLKNPSSLLPICNGENSETRELITTAESRWVSIVGSDLANFDLVNKSLPTSLLTKVANTAEHLDIKYKAASLITDPGRLEQILFTPNHSKVHQLCATKIDNENQLERIQKHYLDKDKNVTRIIKGKLQQIKTTLERKQALQAEIDRILEAIETLGCSQYADDYHRRFSLLKENWNKLLKDKPQAFTNEIQQRFGEAKLLCHQTVDSVEQQKKQLADDVSQILESLQKLADSLRSSPAELGNIATMIQETRKRWPKGHDLTPFYTLTAPLEQLDGQYQHWLKIESRAQRLRPEELLTQLSRLHWPSDFTSPVELSEVRNQVELKLAEKQQSKSEHQARIAELDQQLAQLTEAIEQGHLRPAGKLLSALNHQLQGFAAPQRILNGIASSASKLAELRDWQGFATNPKREELCNSMENLAQDSAIVPQEKADAIKELQDAWKKLGSSDSRQGQQLWSRFKKQGDLAFKPCAVYFEQLKKIREQNLVEKEKICASLELFLDQNDWQHADWKAVSDIMYTSRQEWRKYDDLVRAKRKKIQDRFNHNLEALYAKLRQEHERNHELKSALIKAVEVLLETDVSVLQMIEQTKTLQARWKSIGITDRRVDQKLWKKFRSECDKVFNKREDQNVAHRQKVDAVTIQAKEVCNSLSELLASDAPISHSDIRRFKKQFDALVLSKHNDYLGREFQRLLKSARQAVEQQQHASQIQVLEELKRLAQLCGSLESGQIDEATLAQAWQSEIELDKDLRKRIDSRRTRSTNQEAADPAVSERLCIQLEILAGIDSPAESQTARLAYQVDRLNRELAQGLKETRTIKEQLRDVQINWYCLSVTEENASLTARFQRAEAKLGG